MRLAPAVELPHRGLVARGLRALSAMAWSGRLTGYQGRQVNRSGVPRFSLFTRLMLGAAVSVAAVVALFGWRLDARSRRTFIAQNGAMLRNQTTWTARLLSGEARALRRDVVLLSRLPAVQDFVSAAPRGSVRAAGDGGLPRLERALAAFARSDSTISRIQLATVDGGRVLVSLDDADRLPGNGPREALGSAAGTDWFDATISRAPGAIFTSGIQREQAGVDTTTTRRVIRAAMSLFGADGQRVGALMIERDIGRWIDATLREVPPGVISYFVGMSGEDLGPTGQANDSIARLEWLMEGLAPTGVPTDTLPHWDRLTWNGELIHVARTRVQLDPESESSFVVHAFALPDREVSARLARVHLATIVGSVSVAVTLLVGGLLIVLWALHPFRNLRRVAERVGAGDYDAALPADESSDLGAFAGALRSMVNGIRAREDESRRATVALRESEARFRRTLDDMQEGCQIIGFDWRYLYVNDSVARHGRKKAEDLLGRTMMEAYPGIDQAPFFARLSHCMANRATQRFENEFVYPDGTAAWFDLVINPSPDGLFITSYDITDRKRQELDLRESVALANRERERAEALLQVVPDAVVISDLDGRIADLNVQAEALFGHPRADLLGAPCLTLFPERVYAEFLRIRNQLLAVAGSTRLERDLMARRKDGSAFHTAMSLGPLRTAEGVHVIATFRDVTEQREAARRVHKQVEHLTLLDQITRAIAERQDLHSIFQTAVTSIENELPVDLACALLYDSVTATLSITALGAKAAALDPSMRDGEMIGIDQNGLSRVVTGQLVYERDIAEVRMPFPERLHGRGLRSLVLAPLRAESRVFGAIVAARHDANAFTSTECEFLRQATEHLALGAHQTQLHGALKAAYDDLRQSQQAAMQIERLQAMSQMASGIAHDINNALSPVSLYAEVLLSDEHDLNARTREYLEQIRLSVRGAADTVSRMREFSRPQDSALEPTTVALNELVQKAVAVTHARWGDIAQSHGRTINAVTDLAADLPEITGVESEIRDSLTNLIFNAIDAMPSGGTMTIRTRLVPSSGGGRTRVAVEVGDDGIGMDEATRLRCLEPFFTTKGDRGTGLGLAMVFGTVQRHSGRIEVESAPGQGTTVRMSFPVTVESSPARSDGAAEAHPGRLLRVLLVDDDPVLLKSLEATLALDGHATTAANGGQVAIDLFARALGTEDQFDAVITDLGMPKVDGRQVAERVKELSPRTVVIMLTGWGRRLVAERDVPPNVDQVLSKPPTLQEIRAALALVRGGVPEQAG